MTEYPPEIIEEIRQGARKLPPGKTDRRRPTTRESYPDELKSARAAIHGELRRLLEKDPLSTKAHIDRVIRRVSKFEDDQIAADIASIRAILG